MNGSFLVQLSTLLGASIEQEEVSFVLPKLSQVIPFEELSSLLSSDPGHPLWAELSRELTVPETYFYRVQEHWVLLQSLLQKAAAHGHNLKIWCAAASTGEEPYTVAIEATRARAAVDIVATDLVAERLKFAREGVYTENSFRGVPSDIKGTFFTLNGRSFQLIASVREAVRFAPLNLADGGAVRAFCLREGPFDIILCRNILIYFTEEVCKAVTENIAAALKPQGLLFAGAADFPSRWNDGLESVQLEGALVWRHKTASKDVVRRLSTNHPGLSRQKESIRQSIPKEKGRSKEPALAHLFLGEDLRDRLEAARGYVDAHLLHPVGHLALGNVLEKLQQHDAAVTAYKKVVFLEPTCAYAHIRLAHLHITAKRGKAARHHLGAARRYRDACDTTRHVLNLLELNFDQLIQSIGELGEWADG